VHRAQTHEMRACELIFTRSDCIFNAWKGCGKTREKVWWMTECACVFVKHYNLCVCCQHKTESQLEVTQEVELADMEFCNWEQVLFHGVRKQTQNECVHFLLLRHVFLQTLRVFCSSANSHPYLLWSVFWPIEMAMRLMEENKWGECKKKRGRDKIFGTKAASLDVWDNLILYF
jgi:hypothetical protein